MNRQWVRWLLDLEVIPAGAEEVRLVWEHPWPAWLWVMILLLAGLVAGWSYTHLLGARQGRAVLATTRFLLAALVLVIVSGPMLELSREMLEQDWVLVLVDRSASMQIADVDDAAGRRSRDEQLRALLDDHQDMWRELAEARHVVWLGFHDGTFNLQQYEPPSEPDPAADPQPVVELGDANGSRTRLNAALEQAMQRAAARALSGIVVLSDGRTTDPPSRAIIRRLRSEKVGVFTVPLGSSDPLGDLSIRRVEAPRRAFVRDKVPVVVELDQLGSARARVSGVVKLIDEATGDELDRVELPAGGVDHVTMTAEPQLAGEATWRVVVETREPDLVAENNVKSFLIELIDRPLRVLFVDGYPRWEYRYIKNLLIREKSIESSVMLISADRDFAQEGNQPITRLPRSPAEFAPFDVLILGDVPASFFAPEQLEMIRDHVAQRGAGLLWVAGERSTPRTYTGSVLADLLPMRGSLALPPIGRPVNMIPTPLAERLGLLRLSENDQAPWPPELADPKAGWSQLHYAQRIEPGRLKPTAEVLAQTVEEFRGAQLPLVIHMRYGAGQIVYVATDEIWRWRYGRGELLPERFWLDIIRRLGRERIAGSDEAASLRVTPRRLTTGQAMRIDLELLDARLVDETRVNVTAIVETDEGHPIAELDLRRRGSANHGDVAGYGAMYLPRVAGQLWVRVEDPTLEGLKLQVSVEVFAADDELRRPDTDHGLLRALAAETGGRTVEPDQLAALPQLLPNRSVRTINPLTERIWDTPLAFALVLLLLTGEWIGRKMLRLA